MSIISGERKVNVYFKTYNKEEEEDGAGRGLSVLFGSNHGLADDAIEPKGYCEDIPDCNERFPCARANESWLLVPRSTPEKF